MVRTFRIQDGLVPSDFLHSAHDHLTAAQALFETNPSHYDSAGYLAHMGVELLLKSWLLEEAGQFEGIHNLETLYAQLVGKHAAPGLEPEHAEVLEMLDQFEQLRYPNPMQPTEVGEDDWLHIESLVGFICRSMPAAISEALDKAPFGKKGGRVLMHKKIE
jgi:HEPN domain-containing protein